MAVVAKPLVPEAVATDVLEIVVANVLGHVVVHVDMVVQAVVQAETFFLYIDERE